MTSLIGKKAKNVSHTYTNTGEEGVTPQKTNSQVNSGYEVPIDNNLEPSKQDFTDYNKLVSPPRSLAVVDSTRRGSERSANPYAIDAASDFGFVVSKGIINDGYEESKDFDPKTAYNTLNGSFTPGEVYQTISEAKGNPVRKLSRKLKQSLKERKRRHSNRELDPYAVDLVEDQNANSRNSFVYEDVNDDHSHQYADLGGTDPKKPEPPSYPRRKPNKLYEPSDAKKKKTKEEKDDNPEKRCCCLRESQLIKLLLFVIMFLFLLCLFLVILLITGTLRIQTADSQPATMLSQQKSPSFEPIQKTIENVQENITKLQKLFNAQANVEKMNITSLLQKYFNEKFNSTRSNLEAAIHKSVTQIMTLNETVRRTSQQYSRSVDPLKMTIAELQANLTKLEALLNKTKTNLNIPANDSISIFDVQRNFDQKLNATKDQLLAEDGRIKGEVSALNISLNSKIQGISGVEVKQGPPGYNGSRGDPGPIGPQGIQGPPGLGNFSQCRHLVETQTTHSQSSISIIANKVQPEGYIILSASCSTVGTVEYNLEINVPSVGGNPNFVCTCKGKSALFPSPDSKYYCHLHYLLCPKTT